MLLASPKMEGTFFACRKDYPAHIRDSLFEGLLALKSSPPAKQITMLFQSPIRIAVEDTGVGLPPENLTRIFSHGFTTRRDGHGFGLHSAANAARRMGGALWAESDGLSCGATFTLELSLRARETAKETQSA